ncbi:MAG: hypothetical protein A4E45_01761 [Methanosaeta sp. PtaB.Bin039]|nr:MAG: hypothetical protein A4E45_01761 [Methanosaeta sp. PtaB.Bin039]
MRGFILSLDPAQVRDWSALAAVKAVWKAETKTFTYRLVNIERLQKVPYDEIVAWTIRAFRTPAFRQDVSFGPILCLDSTGVGVAIRDMFLKAGVQPVSISITSGNGHSVVGGDRHVGKARLIGKFLAAFDAGRFQIPDKETPALVQLQRELKSFRAELSTAGNARFEAEPGEHDDLVLACSMAAWFGEDVLKDRNVGPLVFSGATKPHTFGSGRSGGGWFAEAARHHGGGSEFLGGIHH